MGSKSDAREAFIRAQTAAHAANAGRILLGGKYEPVAPAGEGGMASVWLGYTHGEVFIIVDLSVFDGARRIAPRV